ncbi:MAG TPA: amino acid permease [Nocardioides bacterium]|uniref:APC family permease n=1 Tax=uncultured Nocardioides sp. TaxID=198441 RepID=UPI000EED6D56|nr:amino acid permease [uncultured Nocardioides sp.]HCB06076.1 amino acid permease [Nocardioides sp.]
MTSVAPPTQPADPQGAVGGRLDVPQGAALTIGAVLGTGVISLPALAVQEAGPASLLAWAGLLLVSIPLATTFASLGARYPDGGGVSTYARRAFGARAATVVGWCFYFAIPIGAPTAAGFAGAYVADAAGGGRATQLLATGGIIVLVAAMNWFGLRVSGRVQLGIAGVLALLLGGATLVSLPHAELGNLTPFAPHGWLAVGTAAAMLVWAFAGWEVVTSLSAEYRNPARDIGRATGIAIAVISVLYLGVAFATVAVLGDQPGTAPLSDLLVLGFGEAARPVITVVAVLLSVGAINAYFAGGARLGAALARDGSLPVWLARGSTAGEVPRRSLAVVTLGALASLTVITVGGLSLSAPLLMTTGTFTLVYAFGTAAALRLLPRGSWVRRGAAVGFLATLGLLVLTGTHLLGPILIAAGALLWTAVRGRREARPIGAARA